MDQKLIENLRRSILTLGEFRIHLRRSKGSGTVTARVWHPDGFRVGYAGGGYDRAGSALGQAMERFLGPELLRSRASKHYGAKLYDGRVSLDGSCGMESMLAILRACGFNSAEQYDTDTHGSSMVLALAVCTKPRKRDRTSCACILCLQPKGGR